MATGFIDEIGRRIAVPGRDLAETLLRYFRDADGRPRPLMCAELLARGRSSAESAISSLGLDIGNTQDEATNAAADVVHQVLGWNVVLTGAEAVTALLGRHAVTHVFCYAGTSELAICDAVELHSGMTLVNSRGDKEGALMAAGASLLRPHHGAAILHGARGLTNAAGGIADVRRNEICTTFLVGLPSTSYTRFLPPHGEAGLVETMRAFVGWAWEAPKVPDGAARRLAMADEFVTRVEEGMRTAVHAPHSPALLGLPQDVAEQRWIPLSSLVTSEPVATGVPSSDSSTSGSTTGEGSLEHAAAVLRTAHRPIFLIDDYALRYPGMRQSLDLLSGALGAAVAQVRYRRGAMLFERIQHCEVANFVGWLDPSRSDHRGLLSRCDLLVTIEDRNMYPRIVGPLPGCRKLAINSDPAKVAKNEYLDRDDLLLVGDVGQAVSTLAGRLGLGGRRASPWFAGSIDIRQPLKSGEAAPNPVAYVRGALANVLAGALANWPRPVLVDDSQMFGGLLAEHYHELPDGLRVFGSHGGFVGSGIGYAVGLAVANEGVTVMCTLGDQGFTNALQGLTVAAQQRAHVCFIVCNNGGSVSLTKQALASFGGQRRGYLANVPGFDYRGVAAAMGIPAVRIEIPSGAARMTVDFALDELSAALHGAAQPGPKLIELAMPADPDFWDGIWSTEGINETRQQPSPVGSGERP